MPEPTREVGGGTAEVAGPERQACAARPEKAGDEASMLMGASSPRVFPVNRRIRNRTYGGVGAGAGDRPSYPISTAPPTTYVAAPIPPVLSV